MFHSRYVFYTFFIVLTFNFKYILTSVVVQRITPAVEHGEGPHWDVKSQKLYYVDIAGQKIMRFDPSTEKVTSAYLKCGPVGVVVPVRDSKDKLIAGCGREIVEVTWDGESDNSAPPIKKIASLDTNRNDTRVNDGKCDPAGRFWIGTMGPEVNNVVEPDRGSLYMLNSDMLLKKEISPVSVSNGLIWNLQKDKMYYIDSGTKQIWSYDYDNANGVISNKQVLLDLPKNNINGIPDGMTRDADGNLWVALFNGGAVIQVNPKNGRLMRTVKLPVEKTSSLVFGGPNLDILYVTTSRVGLTDEQIKKTPDAGSLYAIEGLGVHGSPSNSFKCNEC